jgi:hypothetical protein
LELLPPILRSDYMATKKRTRDRRFSLKMGNEPNVGRRYVIDGKVRIEWFDDGKRRSRTIGENSPEVRQRADEALGEILQLSEPGLPALRADNLGSFPPVEQALRRCAASILDVADALVESVAEAAPELLLKLRKKKPSEEPSDESSSAE